LLILTRYDFSEQMNLPLHVWVRERAATEKPVPLFLRKGLHL